MNREILFRGKRVDDGEWIYGSLVTGAFVKSATGQDIPYIFNTDECDAAYCFEDFTDDYGYYEVDPATVGQFTGLTDSKGNKVFEGDILIHKDTNPLKLVAKYVTDNMYSSCLRLCYLSDNKEYRQAAGKFYEIIGNIHDNPELIRKEVSNG